MQLIHDEHPLFISFFGLILKWVSFWIQIKSTLSKYNAVNSSLQVTKWQEIQWNIQ